MKERGTREEKSCHLLANFHFWIEVIKSFQVIKAKDHFKGKQSPLLSMNHPISPITSHKKTIIFYSLEFFLGHISTKFLSYFSFFWWLCFFLKLIFNYSWHLLCFLILISRIWTTDQKILFSYSSIEMNRFYNELTWWTDILF